ncbi:MAG: DUF1992 domain-containing protein [Gammaproteobacteria bacterium]
MWLIDKMAEQRIAEAERKGAFEDLPGAGKPLQLDDESHIPESLRTGYRLLKNAGYLPPEMQARKEIVSLQHLLEALDPADDNEAYDTAHKRLHFLLSALNLNNAGSVAMEAAYYEKLQRLPGRRGKRNR